MAAAFLLYCFIALFLRPVISRQVDLNRYTDVAESMESDNCPVFGGASFCQSAELKGVSGVSSYFTICPDDSTSDSGDECSENMCYYSSLHPCCPNINQQLTSCNSTSTLRVGDKEFQVTFLNVYKLDGDNIPDQVCFQIDSSTDLQACECKRDCVEPPNVCLNNTKTGRCNGGLCECKEGFLPPDCCKCDRKTHYGPDCKPFCPDNCKKLYPLTSTLGGCEICEDYFITSPECCNCEAPTQLVGDDCKCLKNLAEDRRSCKEGFLEPNCCKCDNTAGNSTHGVYTTENGECKYYCKLNCEVEGDEGCDSCKRDYQTAPECCDCKPPLIKQPDGTCLTRNEPECSTVDLYFFYDATISFTYINFCKSIAVAQMLTAAFNPSSESSSSIKTYGLLFPLTSEQTIEDLYSYSDTCSNIVEQFLPSLIRDFYSCKSDDQSYTRAFLSTCDRDTNALKGFKMIADLAKDRPQITRKAVITLTDGINSDTDNEMNEVKNRLLQDANVNAMIGAVMGTDHITDDLKRYVDKDENAVADKSIIGLTRKIVDRLVETNIICERVANDVITRLNALKQFDEHNTMNLYCNCVPDKQAGRPTCSYLGYDFTSEITYPTCGGSLNLDTKLEPAVQKQVETAKVKTDEGILEEEIIAAVENVLNSYHD